MKYIRTKDTIFEVVEETDLVYRVKAKGNPNNIYSKSKRQNEVINQADTIEELCDEFIEVDKETHKTQLVDFYVFYNTDLSKYDYYAGIWTDKGLIYVAKMNEKGELELL